MFRIPPPYLWTPLSPQRVKGCSPLTIPKMRSKRKKASRCAKRFFLVSPICCFAADFTPLQNVKFCESVIADAKRGVRKRETTLRAGGAGGERGYAGLSSLLRAKREPEKHPLLSRRGNRRVAAPSVCFATARILLAAAPTAPPCIRRRRRSSPSQERGCSPLSDPEGVVEAQKC